MVVFIQIAMKSLSLIRYLSDNLEDLPLGLTMRMVVTHDIPVLLIWLLVEKPWVRRPKNKAEEMVYQGTDWVVSALTVNGMENTL